MRTSFPSLGWPAPDTWSQARSEFGAAFSAFEAEVNGQLMPASEPEGVNPPELDQMEVWRRVGRSGAPAFVRNNAWLLLAWGLWCVKKEEPALVWFGLVAALLMTITVAYPLVRMAVGLALKAGGL